MRTFALVLVLAVSSALGQPPDPPAFEVASVRRSNPDAVGGMLRGGPGTDDPGQFTHTNFPLQWILRTAFGVQPFQLSGPVWLSTEKYDIVAKIPPGTTQQQFQAMLQRLLAERFHLTVHRETRDFKGYELVVARNGPKLKQSAPNAAPDQTLPPSFGELPPETRSAVLAGMPLGTSKGVLMAGRAGAIGVLVGDLSMILGMPIVNKTGLTGTYDYNLAFEPQVRLAAAGTDQGDPLPSIFTAIQEQLGLRLEEKKLPFEVVVIDHADKVPTDN